MKPNTSKVLSSHNINDGIMCRSRDTTGGGGGRHNGKYLYYPFEARLLTDSHKLLEIFVSLCGMTPLPQG